MANVSKNIKEYRVKSKLTQEELAQRLSVTRQTVSSWETGRTQPDLNTLEAIASNLGVDMETLVYGKHKKVNVDVEQEETKHRRRLLTAVLAVVGSLLVAVGLIILFVSVWDDFGDVIKSVLAFLPLLVGAGFGLFSLFKKRDNKVWLEIGSSIWVAGLCATIALVNSIFAVDFGFQNLLLADLLFVAAIALIFKSILPFTAFGVMLCVFAGSYSYGDIALWFGFVPLFVVFIVGIVVTVFFIRGTEKESVFNKVAVWEGIISLVFSLCYVVLSFFDNDFFYGSDFGIVIPIVASAVIGLYLADNPKLRYGFGKVAIILMGIINMPIGSVVDPKLRMLVVLPIVFAMIGIGAYIGRKAIAKEVLRVPIAICTVAGVALNVLIGWEYEDIFIFVSSLITCAYAILVTVNGVKKLSIFDVNVGIITLVITVLMIAYSVFFELWVLALIFILSGVGILVSNKILIHKFREAKLKSQELPMSEASENEIM